jgi:hypothetical protein
MEARDQAVIERAAAWWNVQLGVEVFRMGPGCEVAFVPAPRSGLAGETFLSVDCDRLGGGTVAMGREWLEAEYRDDVVTGRDVIVRHELGHVLGLGHQPDQRCLMWGKRAPATELCDAERQLVMRYYASRPGSIEM